MREKGESFKWVLSELSDLESFSDDFRSYCEEKNLDDGKIFELELSMEELIVNSFTHGYQEGDREGTVVVEVEDTGANVRISLSDQAPPFDLFRDAPAPRLGGEDPVQEGGQEAVAGLETPPLPATDAPLDEEPKKEKVGGLGIHLVKSLNDRVEYYGSQDGNIVIIIKSKT